MSQSVNLPYGAFELKRRYQRNMALGTAFGFFLTLIVITVIWLLLPSNGGATDSYVDRDSDGKEVIIEFQPPPSVEEELELPEVRPPAPQQNEWGRLVIIDDSGYREDDTSFPTRDELRQGQQSSNRTGNGSGVMPPIIDDPVPPIGTFVPFEEGPVMVHEELSKFPRWHWKADSPPKYTSRPLSVLTDA